MPHEEIGVVPISSRSTTSSHLTASTKWTALPAAGHDLKLQNVLSWIFCAITYMEVNLQKELHKKLQEIIMYQLCFVVARLHNLLNFPTDCNAQGQNDSTVPCMT
jgi:hypothetical protein